MTLLTKSNSIRILLTLGLKIEVDINGRFNMHEDLKQRVDHSFEVYSQLNKNNKDNCMFLLSGRGQNDIEANHMSLYL